MTHRQHAPAGLWLWSAVSTFLSLSGIIGEAFGVHVKPGMRMPLVSASLGEFWARRWNIPMSSVLRSLCYAPLVQPSAAMRAPSSTATQAGNGHTAISQSGRPMTRSSARTLLAHRSTARHRSRNGVGPGGSTTLDQHAGAADFAKAASQLHHGHWGRRLKRRLQGLAACFVVSGLCHHWLIHVMTGKAFFGTDWRWFALFLLQPGFILGQELLQRSNAWRMAFSWSPAAGRCGASAFSYRMIQPSTLPFVLFDVRLA
jgi:hypothetical protein